MRRRGLVVALLVVLMTGSAIATAAATSSYDVNVDAHVRGVVLFVGDSNETRAGAAINAALTSREDAYAPLMASRAGAGIRGRFGCACAGKNYWQVKLADIAAVTRTVSAVVVDLGINDALAGPGSTTTEGYGDYSAKIDWLMGLLPANVPIVWTNLPCTIEPAVFMQGCAAVNRALNGARARWSRLVVLDWATAAHDETSYMDKAPHYSSAGYIAWSDLVVKALDARTSP